MAKDNLPEYLDIIKHPLEIQEQLAQILFRAETLVDLVLRQDLTTYPLSKLHDCLLILSDFIQKARRLCEALLSTTLLLPKGTPH